MSNNEINTTHSFQVMECDRVTDIRRVGRSEASVQLDEAVGHSQSNGNARRLVLPDSNCPEKVLVKTLRSLFRQYNYTVSRYSLNVFHDSMTVRNEELELFSQRHGFLIMPDMAGVNGADYSMNY